MFSYAQKELFLLDDNAWINISKPRKPKARNRRISNDEVNTLLNAFVVSMYQPLSLNPVVFLTR